MAKTLTGLELLNTNENIVGIFVIIKPDTINIEDIIIDSELEHLENVEDKAYSKWNELNEFFPSEEMEDEELNIFAKVRVGARTKDFAYWSDYESEDDFELIKDKVREVFYHKKKLKEESDHQQINLFD